MKLHIDIICVICYNNCRDKIIQRGKDYVKQNKKFVR